MEPPSATHVKRLTIALLAIHAALLAWSAWRHSLLEHHRLPRPAHAVLQQFNRVVTGTYRKARLLGKQNVKLKEARDLLLPRLMSGQIEV